MTSPKRSISDVVGEVNEQDIGKVACKESNSDEPQDKVVIVIADQSDDVATESQPDSKQESQPEVQPELQQEVQSESHSEPQPEETNEAETPPAETQVNTQPNVEDTQQEVQLDGNKTEPQPETQSETVCFNNVLLCETGAQQVETQTNLPQPEVEMETNETRLQNETQLLKKFNDELPTVFSQEEPKIPIQPCVMNEEDAVCHSCGS